jgi:hypothetical protein
MWIFLGLAWATNGTALDTQLDLRATEVAARLAADPAAVRAVLEERIRTRLGRWPGEPTPEDVERKLVDFEAERLERYVSSGVFPKVYFGYLDTRGDTERWEWGLREQVQCVRKALNAAVADIVVTDQDLVVTFLAEGGALMLDSPTSPRDGLHPVIDVGLDDIARGTGDLSNLVVAVDGACGTHLGDMVQHTPAGSEPPMGAVGRLVPQEGHEAWLMRWADLADAVAGTGVMWVWEARIADRKLAAEGRVRWSERDPAARFIAGSLVYNSGILHAESTHRSIREFRTGSYLFERSERNAARRPRLNLLAPEPLLAELLDTKRYRPQWTSWVAVYHVLQRYGAWTALRDHTDWFDGQGNFTVRSRRSDVPKPAAVHPSPESPEPSQQTKRAEAAAPPHGCGCGCGHGPTGVGWLPLVLTLLGVVGRVRRPPFA